MTARDEPGWLSELRQEALGSGEWAEISRLIQTRVRDELTRRGLGLWADLSAQEQDVLLNEVSEEVRNDAAFDIFYSRLGGSIDNVLLQQEGLAHTEREELRRNDLKKDAETNRIGHLPLQLQPKRHPDMAWLLKIAGDGASALLRRHPDNFHVLRVIGCRGLPAKLRFEVWKLQLRNAVARKEYLAMVAEDRMSVLSKRDPDIVKSCRSVLAEFDGVGEILQYCKSILSYIHRRHGGLVESPLRYIAIVLVWALFDPSDGGAGVCTSAQCLLFPLSLLTCVHMLQLDNAMLVEYMLALLEETGYARFRTQTHTHTHTRTHAQTHTHTHTHFLSHTHIRTHTNTNTHIHYSRSLTHKCTM